MTDTRSTPPQPLAERLRFLVAERRHVQLGVVDDDLLAAADLIENLAKAYVAERDVLLAVKAERPSVRSESKELVALRNLSDAIAAIGQHGFEADTTKDPEAFLRWRMLNDAQATAKKVLEGK